jgi:serine/threonine protein kinase
MTWLSDETLDHLGRLPDPPDVAGPRYRLLEEIGRGGMGIVYLAEDLQLQRQVALKVLSSSAPAPAACERMLREARIIAGLEHPGIVPVHDAGVLPDGRVFYAMKLVRGQRLDAYSCQLYPLADRLRVFSKVCDAVAFAHAQGVLHRDLKPENLMVGEFGEVLVMDWGVAKTRHGPALAPGPTSPGTVLGTAGFMSPEQARGETDCLDERSDVYALGLILRYLVSGCGPPKRLRAICDKASAADPGLRYPAAGGLGDDIARFLDGLPVSAYRETLLERLGRTLSRNRTAVILVVTYLLMRTLLLFFARR